MIRLATPDDAASVRDILVPIIETTTISFELTPPSVDEVRRRIADVLAFAPWLVFDDDGVVRGFANSSRFRTRAAYRFTVETSIYVAESTRGRGVGRSLYRALLECLRIQGFRRAVAGIALPNEASIRLHESTGFRRVATFPNVGYKLGRWIDVAFWDLQLLPPTDDPPEPLSIADATATPQWRAALTL